MAIHTHHPHLHLPAVVHRHAKLFVTLVAVIAVGAIAGIWLAQRSSPATQDAAIDWVPDYGVDSSLVINTPPLIVPFVGGDANLDPDVAPWEQAEYAVDTPLVIYTSAGAAHWVGGDANLDPDVAPWEQAEYGVDTPLVTYENPGITHWVGGDADLDPDQ